jgi:hypothetical protein
MLDTRACDLVTARYSNAVWQWLGEILGDGIRIVGLGCSVELTKEISNHEFSFSCLLSHFAVDLV